jgi:hypothetical protein
MVVTIADGPRRVYSWDPLGLGWPKPDLRVSYRPEPAKLHSVVEALPFSETVICACGAVMQWDEKQNAFVGADHIFRLHTEAVERPVSAPDREPTSVPGPEREPAATPRDLDPALAAMAITGADARLTQREAEEQAKERDKRLGRGFTRQLRERIGVTRIDRTKSPSRTKSGRRLERVRAKARRDPDSLTADDLALLRHHPYRTDQDVSAALADLP